MLASECWLLLSYILALVLRVRIIFFGHIGKPDYYLEPANGTQKQSTVTSQPVPNKLDVGLG